MAAGHRLGGWDGLLLGTVTLLAGVYTWVASRLLRSGLHPLPAGLVLALVLLASSHQFHVRPLILTIALLGVVFAELIDVEAGRSRLRRLWWFVPLAALWANLHAGVLAGIGTIGLCAAGWCLLGLLGRDSPVRRPRDILALAAVVLGAALAVLVNPYGLDLPRAWLGTLAIPLPDLIQEHGRLELADPLGLAAVLLGVGYVVALLGIPRGRLRVTWLLPLVWFVLACGRVRNVPLFALMAAIALADLLPHARWAKWLQCREMFLPPTAYHGSAGASPSRPPTAYRWALIPLVLVVAAVLLQVTGVSVPILGRGWAKFDPALWPVELIGELEKIEPKSPEDARIFNDLRFGGFLIYHAPHLKVFIDDRCALYGSELLGAYHRASSGAPWALDGWQKEYGFRHALVETGGTFDGHLESSPAWTKIGRTPAATLYRRD